MAKTTPGYKDQYDEMANEYSTYDKLPMARLEAELIRTALGDCTGLTILDLGGGSGPYARQAVKTGARQVDVVDISDAMLQIGRDIESKSADKEGRIRWLLADASKPLSEQDIDVSPGQYDVAMVNWTFEHAQNVEELRGMWENVATGLKPGGKFIGIRILEDGLQAGKDGKYGIAFGEVKTIPGGLECETTLLTDPPMTFPATPMEDSFKMINSIPQELGIVDFETIPPAEAEVVKNDPEFWEEHVKKPLFAVVVARKK